MIVIHTPEGKITQTIDGIPSPEILAGLDEQGVGYVNVEFNEGDDIHDLFGRNYIAGGRLTERPALDPLVSKAEILSDGADKTVISGLPKPCIVRVDGQAVERKAGTITLTADVPATYRVEVDQWPYLPWSVEVVAT